ncbi:MAG: DUF5989 family protein [Planctomycetota bacterium]|nr:DUF5989 family protein [Planctomycetota bacterium]
MRMIRKLASGASTVKELLIRVWSGPNWWLVPVILILLPLSLVLVLLNTMPLVAPFVYTIF